MIVKIHYISFIPFCKEKNRPPKQQKLPACRRQFQTVKKASQSFLRKQKIESKNILCRGVYLTQNTSQAASVEFVRQRRTNYARGRLQKKLAESPERGFSTSSNCLLTAGSFLKFT